MSEGSGERTDRPRERAQRRPAGTGQRREASQARAAQARPKAPQRVAQEGTRPASGLWTPANIVTLVRIALIPLWLLAAELAPASDGTRVAWLALLVALFYIGISATDKLDGYLARSRNEVTTFGKFLDPIADKLVVTVALCFLLEDGLVPSWVLLVVLAREFLVSGLRMVEATKGVVVAASNLGKWKTAVTMVAICGLLLVRCLPSGWLYRALLAISQVLLYAAVALTAWSGVDYFLKGGRYLVEE